MGRRSCTFRQQDVTRALRATKAAGLEVQRYEIDRNGKIVVIVGKPDAPAEAEPDAPPGVKEIVL